MAKITAHLSISLDGYVAGPDQSESDPIGVGGLGLHQWHFDPTDPVDKDVTDNVILAPRGAYVMGRNMFGPVRGEWGDSAWTGWWGDEPPYHAPVFLLTHHEHDPIELTGTTFHFVSDFDSALEQAVAAAGDDLVTIAGGASAVRQGLERGVVDELLLTHVPVTLGAGESIFEGLALTGRQVEVSHSQKVTNVFYTF